MSVRVTLQQVENDLSGLLDQVAESGEEFVVQRKGKDCAVIVSALQWRRRKAAQRLDGLPSSQPLSSARQKRAEFLLTAKKQRSLTVAERQELKNLLQECEKILRERANALDAIL